MATDVSDVIDNARFNAFHLQICILCGLMVFFDGFDLSAISYTAPEFIKLFGIERAMIASVFSAGLFGLTVGSVFFGLVADRVGAKRTFIFCGLAFGAFSLATAFADSVSTLLVYRFLAGLALGGASPISIAIVSNAMPKHVRTSATVIMYISLAVGSIVAGYAYGFFSFFGWRTVFYFGGVLPILLAPVFYSMLPETVVFQVMHNAPPERIRAVLARLDPNRDFSHETYFTVPRENKAGFQPLQLFQDGRAPITAVLWVVFFHLTNRNLFLQHVDPHAALRQRPVERPNRGDLHGPSIRWNRRHIDRGANRPAGGRLPHCRDWLFLRRACHAGARQWREWFYLPRMCRTCGRHIPHRHAERVERELRACVSTKYAGHSGRLGFRHRPDWVGFEPSHCRVVSCNAMEARAIVYCCVSANAHSRPGRSCCLLVAAARSYRSGLAAGESSRRMDKKRITRPTRSDERASDREVTVGVVRDYHCARIDMTPYRTTCAVSARRQRGGTRRHHKLS